MDPLKNANVEENVVSKLRVCLDTAYFAKNQKHCSKIIFKCVNSVVGSIFNESFGKKKVCGSCEQYTRPTGKDRNMLLQKKKKKAQDADAQVIIRIQTDTKGTFGILNENYNRNCNLYY